MAGRYDGASLFYLKGKEMDSTSGGPLVEDSHAYWSSYHSYDPRISQAWGYAATAIQVGSWLIPPVGLAVNIFAGGYNRYLSHQSVGQILGGGLADGTGVAALWGAFTNRDIATGEDLKWSTGEKWVNGIFAGLQMTLVGAMAGRAARGVLAARAAAAEGPIMGGSLSGAFTADAATSFGAGTTFVADAAPGLRTAVLASAEGAGVLSAAVRTGLTTYNYAFVPYSGRLSFLNRLGLRRGIAYNIQQFVHSSLGYVTPAAFAASLAEPPVATLPAARQATEALVLS